MRRTLNRGLLSLATILTLATAGCAFMLSGVYSTTHSRAEFNEIVATTNIDTLGSVYYKGRKNGFDYFKARWNVGSKNMRVAICESPITKPFDYTTDEKEWRSATFMHLKRHELEQAIPKKLNVEQADGSNQIQR